MSAPEPFTDVVLHDIATIFRDDFEGRFRVLYEDTVKILRALPREPEGEVFNAFEHFSLACKHAAEADTATAEAGSEAKRLARKNLGQARRHLSIGRFFCVEHQIIFTVEAIRAHVAALPDADRAAKAGYQERCNGLERELRATAMIQINPIEDPEELAQAVRDFEPTIEAMTELLNKFLALAEDIVGRA